METAKGAKRATLSDGAERMELRKRSIAQMLAINEKAAQELSGSLRVSVTKLQAGIELHKVGRRSGKPVKRVVSVSADGRELRQRSRRQPLCLLRDVSDVRPGLFSAVFEAKKAQFAGRENEALSIYYTGGTLNVLFASREERDSAAAAIQHLRATALPPVGGIDYDYFQGQWVQMKKKGLSLSEMTTFLGHMNLKAPRDEMKQIFQAVDLNGNGKLEYDEALIMLALLLSRTEVEEYFFAFAGGSDRLMDAYALGRFLASEQGMGLGAAEAEATSVIQEFGHDESGLALHEFASFLHSSRNALQDPRTSDLYQDMTQPLPHYFINSSHNTYLEADQLKGASSTQMYIKCLLAGCRCVELDTWDGKDGEPIIFHGHTLTSKILFRDVILAVRDYAFKASPYPVILSLENHCTLQQQDRMAAIMKDIFGDMLATPLGPQVQALPSPEELKFKVLIKGKTLGQAVEADCDDDDDSEAFDALNLTKDSPAVSLGLSNDDKRLHQFSLYSRTSRRTVSQGSKKEPKIKPPAVSPALSALTYLHAVKQCPANNHPYEMSSFAEGKVAKCLAERPEGFVAYTQRQMARVYPKGTRVDSSNYDPVPAWTLGAQLVALNFQTYRRELWLNEGMFRDNGEFGYVLKPDFLRQSPLKVIPTSLAPLNPVTKYTKLTVKVLNARALPKVNYERKGEIIDPFVQVEIVGVRADCRLHKTRVVEDNGFRPTWNETFEFPLVLSQLALLLIRIEDFDVASKNDPICHYALPVHCLSTEGNADRDTA